MPDGIACPTGACAAQAHCTSLPYEIAFLWTLGDWQSYGGEASYYLTTMEAGLMFLIDECAFDRVCLSRGSSSLVSRDSVESRDAAPAEPDSSNMQSDSDLDELPDDVSGSLDGPEPAEARSGGDPEVPKQPSRSGSLSGSVGVGAALSDSGDPILTRPKAEVGDVAYSQQQPCAAKCGLCDQCDRALNSILGAPYELPVVPGEAERQQDGPQPCAAKCGICDQCERALNSILGSPDHSR